MKRNILLFAVIFLFTVLFYGFRFKDKSGEGTYKKYCGTCHGGQLQGGLGQSLADGKWQFGDDDLSIIKNIKSGFPDQGMPAFEKTLNDTEINNLVAFIRDNEITFKKPDYDLVTVEKTFDYSIAVELVTEDVNKPWAINFLSSHTALITEKPGKLRIIENGILNDSPIQNIPKVKSAGQGGLLDVAIDPDYKNNGWVYLSFSHGIANKSMTKIVRGKLKNNTWVNEETLYEAHEDLYLSTKHHFGSRIVFDKKGHLFFSIGDRGKREHAQDLTKPNGKIHRIFTDGSIPKDNPFYGDEDKIQSIYAYGSRNAQGLSINPQTGELWESEHGQKGGDEINIIKPGKNYGWDKITYGRNYDGTVSTNYVKLPNMEVPILFWRPSIAVCGIDFYKGSLFSKWRNHLIVGALKYEEVRLLDIEDNRVIHQEIILKDAGRVRDVCSAPDGSIYVVLNEPDKVLRITPKK